MSFKNQDLNHPLTVGQFQEHIETLVKVVATKEDLDNKFNMVMNTLDTVLGELKTDREERAMKLARDDQQYGDIKNLKTRVTTVEHRIGLEPIEAQ